ncbi:hypothetical protein [uncultured Ruegeria sp.]|uniref:hypothetical protein n=1 Tax=uncultured Ruegeria sp. TaxID=259304 RepID=UPI00262F0B67|nr:hypothetical protein [uncultured Ruegeria sp.]
MKISTETGNINRRVILGAAALIPASAATAFVAPMRDRESADLPSLLRTITDQAIALNGTVVSHISGGDKYVVVRRDRLEVLLRSLSVIS